MKAYLDNMATTPIDPRVARVVCERLSGPPGNPHAVSHPFGLAAAQVVDEARATIALAVGARPAQVVLLPSATAADNLAVLGIATARASRGRHVLVSAIEHPAVLQPAAELARRGFEIEVVPVDRSGVVDPDEVRQRLRPDTTLVSLMAVNNEVGTVQPVAEVARILATTSALLHCDAAQAPGRIPLEALAGADALTLSSHKVYGPCGAAALVLRGRRVPRPRPLVFGGGQEDGVWAGTLNVPSIAGFALAMRLAVDEREADCARIRGLSDRLVAGLADAFPGTERNGHDPIPHCVSVLFANVSGETLLLALARAGVAASFGSACADEASKPSHVLSALCLSPAEARRTLRFGLGRFTTDAEIDRVVEVVRGLAARLREA